MKPILFQHLWSSVAFTGVLKAFGPYPEEGFEISCSGRSFSREGMEVRVPAGPPELWSPQWGPDAGSGVGRACSLPGVSPLRRGWEHAAGKRDSTTVLL